MERELDIRTPESVAIRYELAGLGSRFLAVFLDLVLQGLTAIVLYAAFAFLAFGSVGHERVGGFAAHAGHSLVVAFVSVATFLIFFGYFIVAEWRFNGRTIGKRIVGIRVVRDGGYAIDFLSAAIRNLIRILEAGLAFYALSAIVTLISRENKRLGDYAAGTIVVRDSAMKAAIPALPADTARTLLTPVERSVVDRYLDRRAQLSQTARARVAGRIAQTLRTRVDDDPSYASLDDDSLIVRLAQDHSIR